MATFDLFDEGHGPVNERFDLQRRHTLTNCALGAIKLTQCLTELIILRVHDAFSYFLVVLDMFVDGDEPTSHAVVLNRQGVLALHEVAKSPIEVEQFLEVGVEWRVVFFESHEVIDCLVHLPLHQKDHPLREKPELLYSGGVELQEGSSVDVVEGTVEVPVVDFGTSNFDE